MSKIAVGTTVRIKGTKIEGVAAVDEERNGVRWIRVDHASENGGQGEYWSAETEIEVVEAKAAPR